MAQDIKKRIDKFIKKYPEPQQYPIHLQWRRKDGYHSRQYFGYGTDSQGGLSYVVGSKIIMSQFRYDEKLGLCELSYVEFPHNTPKPTENRRWFYLRRYFIPKGERVLYNADGTTGSYKYIRTSYEWHTNSVVEFARHFANIHGWRNEQFKNEFLRFCGDDIKCKSYYGGDTIHRVWQLPEWFAYVPKTRTTGKVQKTIDELIADGISDIDDNTEAKLLELAELRRYYSDKNVALFDVPHKAFRCFVKLENGELRETKRVYLGGKKPIVAALDEKAGWIPNGSFTHRQFEHKIYNFDDVAQMKYCAYLKSVINSDTPTVYDVVSVMRHSDIEQLHNMGCTSVAKYLARHSDNFPSTVRDCFGATTKAKNVCQKYQLTKKQFDHINKVFAKNEDAYWSNGRNTTTYLKRIFGDNLASLDLDTFVKTYDSIADIDNYRVSGLINQAPNKQAILRIINMVAKHRDAVSLFMDTINSYNSISLANKPQTTPWECKEYNEIIRLHNACVEIRNMEVAEQRRLWDMQEAERQKKLEEKMKTLNKERIKMNYEDDEFIIRLPHTLAEIVNEGSVLHHCVGGYTTNHAQGSCTIMFLRRKSDPDTSFYTIEVSSSNTISQIHGRYNKWLGNDPDAIPTVVRWLRKNNITCSNDILTCKSVGYGKTNEYVTMPQVD